MGCCVFDLFYCAQSSISVSSLISNVHANTLLACLPGLGRPAKGPECGALWPIPLEKATGPLTKIGFKTMQPLFRTL